LSNQQCQYPGAQKSRPAAGLL